MPIAITNEEIANLPFLANHDSVAGQREGALAQVASMKECWIRAQAKIKDVLVACQNLEEENGKVTYADCCRLAASALEASKMASAISDNRQFDLDFSFSEVGAGQDAQYCVAAGDLCVENVRNNLGFVGRAYNLAQLPALTGPVLCLGAGPSAYENLSRIAEFKGEIICCDRILVDVLKQGVIPKYVVTMDASPLTAKFIDQEIVHEHAKEMMLIFAAQAATKTLASWNGPLVAFAGLLDADAEKPLSASRIFAQLTNRVVLPMAGNCGSTTWFVARYLAAPCIVLLGVDLAYKYGTPLEQTHPGKFLMETVKRMASIQVTEREIKQSETEQGENELWNTGLFRRYTNRFQHRVLTDVQFLLMAKAWDMIASNLRSPLECETIQCSEYTIVDGAKWISKCCTFSSYLAEQKTKD